MLSTIFNMFKIPELKTRILWTLFFLFVYRIGCHVPTPGVNTEAMARFFEQAAEGTVFGMFDLFSGGAFSQLTVFSLGIMPYISASIILQLLAVVVPYFEQLQKEGEAGRQKINQYTRYGTIGLAILQSLFISYGVEQMQGGGLVNNPGWGFRLTAMITLTAGTAFIMWLGEQITEKGIGNGISLIIYAGIVAGLPSAIFGTFSQLQVGALEPYIVPMILAIVLAVTGVTCLMQQAQRKVPVQYAKRMVGRKMYGGQNTYIPIKVNTANVMPVIFAQSLIVLLSTAVSFVPLDELNRNWLMEFLQPTHPVYIGVFVIMIFGFTYFYTAVIFNPQDLADNMKKYGGFIPGFKPGAQTAQYLEDILNKITLWGAGFLILISILPLILIAEMNLPFYFGGTALLIVVGVGIDTMQQIESHLVMRHYEGFMSKRTRSRRGRA